MNVGAIITWAFIAAWLWAALYAERRRWTVQIWEVEIAPGLVLRMGARVRKVPKVLP